MTSIHSLESTVFRAIRMYSILNNYSSLITPKFFFFPPQ